MTRQTRMKTIYVDFGVTKPHAVLIGNSAKPFFIDDLNGLGMKDCIIYLEEGCPRVQLARLASNNRVRLVAGKSIKELREESSLAKSDVNDVALIRQLSRQSPSSFREITAPEKEELEDQVAYGFYCGLTTLIASLKNRQWRFVKEFGAPLQQLDETIAILEAEKKRSLTHFAKFAEHARSIGVRGVGPRLLGGILIRAHPDRFRSLSAYLSYCGLKSHAARGGRYSRHVRALYHQLAISTIMHKDPAFYRLYLDLKKDLKQRFPSYRPARIDGMSKNRLATFLAKLIFARCGHRLDQDRIRAVGPNP